MPKVNRITHSIWDLPVLRVTGIKGFEDCPRRWVAEKFEEVLPSGEGKYARIGTAVHHIIELFLTNKIGCEDEDWFETCKYLAQQGVSSTEQENVRQYLRSLESLRERVLAVEYEFTYSMLDEALPIRGHMDAIIRGEDGTSVLIIDHKTNRQLQSAEWWRAQYQPLFYAWAARKMWPQVTSVRYRIGYVNFNTYVEWETSPDDDAWLQERFIAIWTDMAAGHETGFWPERIGPACDYCPRRNECATFNQSLTAMQDSTQAMVSHLSLADRYVWLTTVLKAGAKLKAELEEQILAEAQRDSRVLVGATTTLKISRSKRRSAEFVPVWNALLEFASRVTETDPEAMRPIFDKLGDVFSVKVTGLDALLKDEPGLRASIEPHVVLKESDKATVTVAGPRGLKAASSIVEPLLALSDGD